MDGGFGTSQMPLAGAILCCTSMSPEQRTELAAIGSQMGATIKLDLTSDVTHLLVGSIDSAKYRYVAKAREDVKVLSPGWLEALRTVWMAGDDNVDVAALEKEYTLPTFYGLKICLTGFDDPDQRKFIQDTVVQNGAEYHGDLTRMVTHLIAATTTGKKYEYAVSWKMKIVSWEWFEESRQRGMTLDERHYHPTMAVEERGKGAWDRKAHRSPTPLVKRPRDPEPIQANNPRRRKLRRAASSRMGTQSDALWAGITAAGLETTKSVQDDWSEDTVAEQSILTETAHQDNVAVPQEDVLPVENPASQPPVVPLNRNEEGLFEGRVVFTHGFDSGKTNILQQHLDSNGATVIRNHAEIEHVSSDDLRRGFLVVPHDVPVDLTLLPEGAGKMSLATNWWVERCLHGKRLVNPTDNVLCRPFNNLGISGFDDLIINSTAFAGIELLHVTKVVALMGASYDEMLSLKTSVMICNSRKPNPVKLKFATDKRIPAVHSTWLWECLSTGRRLPFDKYLLNTIDPLPQKSRQKPLQESFAAVPTAPLSSEESAKLQAKKTQAKRDTTKTNGGPQQARTLDLAPSADPAPLVSTKPSTIRIPNPRVPGPFLDEDEDDGFDVGHDDVNPLPLQDINPNVTSPRRQSTSSSAETLNKANSVSTSRSNSIADITRKPAPAARASKLVKETTPDSVLPHDDPSLPSEGSVIPVDTPVDGSEYVIPEPAPAPAPAPAPEKDHASIMASIMAVRKAHAAAAASKTGPHTSKEDEKRNRRRQLGRATSTRSNNSTTDDVISRTSSAVDVAKRVFSAEDSIETSEGCDGEQSFEGKARKTYEEYQPSQELGWDSPGAAIAREKMIREMGGKVEETGTKVASIGVVKDVVSGVGGGLSRAPRKKRG
ncbi:hypothetical protein K504DRAFT_493711 [Pleomassaria siparia CBS 279.74]|uniref:BRCT domain-containing protein n=1 Tax=Pleomassaria siparia CBS 279.74 TaxID=1314801 RepID=A0A6G1K0D1_9PLEO|nr:hypothetical protein K504DRAFT_493711 [Pleomassaria siparia CBS 279.74]